MRANGSIGNLSWLNLTSGQGSPSLLPFSSHLTWCFLLHLAYSLSPHLVNQKLGGSWQAGLAPDRWAVSAGLECLSGMGGATLKVAPNRGERMNFGCINVTVVCSAHFTLNAHNFFLEELEQFALTHTYESIHHLEQFVLTHTYESIHHIYMVLVIRTNRTTI